MLLHPESEIEDGLTSMAVWGKWAAGLYRGDGEVVWGDGGLNVVGMDMGPMSVDRVVSVQAGSSGLERGERAFVPMSMFESWEEGLFSNDMLWMGGVGWGGDEECMHGEGVGQ